jgi:hypothetical protein
MIGKVIAEHHVEGLGAMCRQQGAGLVLGRGARHGIPVFLPQLGEEVRDGRLRLDD